MTNDVSSPPVTDNPGINDRNGRLLYPGSRVILTGTIKQTNPGTGAGNLAIELDGSTEKDQWTMYVDGRLVLTGDVNDRVPGPVIVNALRAAAGEIQNLQRRLSEAESRAQAREDVLQATIVRLHAEAGAGRMPYGVNGCSVSSSSMNVVGHLEALVTAIETPPRAAETKPTKQQCADMEFQAGREIFRRGAEMMDDASDDARYGYEYERSVVEGRKAVENENGGAQA